MNTEIAPGIYYTGVNQRTNKLFESLWPLPYGISYNSYLIVDEKVALIDIAEESLHARHALILKEILGNRPVDYVIINHMEPDHTGALRDLYHLYPDLTVIGNAKTLAMLKGFYGINPKMIEIKDGEIFTLGNRQLQFFLTPMVHWPETMMTYDITTATLFSGDAFGCYGALNGSVIDADMELSRYWEEMRRYYATIVGKYGIPVQSALKKLKDIQINLLCSTHGPVWKNHIQQAIGYYDRYSQYESLPGVVIAYGSMYGNTSLLAEHIAESLAYNGIRNIEVFDVTSTDSSFILSAIFQWKGLILGGPVYNGALFPPLQYLMDEIRSRGIKDRVFGSFGTYAWGKAPLSGFSQFAQELGWQNITPTIEQKYTLQESEFAACDQLASELSKAMQIEI